MDKLFTMYSQFDAEKNHGKEEFGIGLAISKYYIDQMDGTIDVDSHMPVMNGEEATIYIRRMEGNANQNVPIIAITADAVAGVRERLLDCGMNDYIMKPIDIETICGLIRKYLPPAMQQSCRWQMFSCYFD